jgi:hypothetical protein
MLGSWELTHVRKELLAIPTHGRIELLLGAPEYRKLIFERGVGVVS